MRILSVFIFVLLVFPLNSQTREQKREYFDDGVYFLTRNDPGEAAFNFRKLVDAYPQNSHYNFKLGECYMNIPGSEQLAVHCFEVAVKNTTDKKKYRDRDYDESKAPLHAWFYLGNVYRMVGRLDDALNAYNTFINSPLYYGNYNLNVVENEIKACERAKIIMDSPIDALIEPADSVINTQASEVYPIVSADGNSIVFIRKLKFYDAILYVRKSGSTWTPPENLNPLIGSDGEFYPVSFSHDGNTLYLVRKTLENKDIYVSYRRNNIWGKAEPLGSNINTLAEETWASESSDGKVLWFASGRKGGSGGLDIYFSVPGKDGKWGKPRNAGKIINTAFDEDCPALSEGDSVLFFSSKGHYSMGGFDIFYAIKDGKTWKTPVNLGYPVNNTLDNYGYVPEQNGKAGVYSFVKQSEPGNSEDVYRVVLRSNYPIP
jgi:tetratricopeptide (TPR) repeat protein